MKRPISETTELEGTTLQIEIPPEKKSQILQNFINGLNKVSTNYKAGDADITVENGYEGKGEAYHLYGTISMYGVSGVEIDAAIEDAKEHTTITFPSGVYRRIELVGYNIAEWIPELLQGKVDLKEVEITRYPKEEDKYEIIFRFGQQEDQLIVYQNCLFEETTLVFIIKKDKAVTGEKLVRQAELNGNINLGGAEFALKGETNNEKEAWGWKITATRDEIVMRSLIDAVEKYTSLSQLENAPDVIKDITLQDVKVSFDQDKALTITGSSAIGKMEALIVFSGDGKKDFLLGYSPHEDYKLAGFNSNLTYIDGIDLKHLAIVYAHSADAQKEIPLGLLEGLEFASEKVKPGLVLLGKYEMPKGIPLLDNIDAFTVRADIPAEKSESFKLTGKIDFGVLDLGIFKLTDALISIEPEDRKTAIELSAIGDIPELRGGSDTLALSGKGAIDQTKKQLNLMLFMADGDKWDTPFGLPGITISNFRLEVGASGPDKSFGVRGDLVLGNLKGAVAGFLDPKEPMKSMISVRFDELSPQVLINSFFNADVQQYLESLPEAALPASIKDGELTLIPSPMTIAEKPYAPGLRITGKGQIMGLGAVLDLSATYESGLKGYARLNPISVPGGGINIFDLGGETLVDFTTAGLNNPDHVFVRLAGQMNLLGLSRETAIEISRNGFYVFNKGKIFQAFNAVFDARGSNLLQPQDMYLRVAMQSDLRDSLRSAVKESLDWLTKETQGAFLKAWEVLRAAQDAYDKANGVYNEAVNELQKKSEALSLANAGVNGARQAVSNAQAAIDKAWGKLGKIARKLAGEACKARGIKKLCDTLKQAKDILNSKINIEAEARRLRDLAKAALDKATNDLNPLKLALDAARAALNALEEATDYMTMAAKWLINRAPNVIDIKSAEFEGQLDAVKGGRVSLRCNVEFLNKRFKVVLPFNFSDPKAMAKELAAILLEGRADSGWAPTFEAELIVPSEKEVGGEIFLAGDISAVFAGQRNHTEVFCKGKDNLLHYFYWNNGQWLHDGESFRDTPVDGCISSIYNPERMHAEVFFKGKDSLLHHYYVENGMWRHNGLSFKATPVRGDISAIYALQRKNAEIFFEGTDGLLHYYYWNNGKWEHDGTSFCLTPVGGDISAAFAPQRNHAEVFFKGKDSLLHHYYVENGMWRHDGLSFKATPVRGDISAIYALQRKNAEVFFEGADGLLHYYYWNNGKWEHDGTSFCLTPVGGDISAVFAPQRAHAEVFFRGSDGLLHYYYVNNGKWTHDGTSFAATPVAGDIGAVFSKQRNHAEVFFTGIGNLLRYYYVNDNTWDHN